MKSNLIVRWTMYRRLFSIPVCTWSVKGGEIMYHLGGRALR